MTRGRRRGAMGGVLSLWAAAYLTFLCPAEGQTQTVDDMKRAFALLRQYQADVENVRSVASRPLGPYQISTSCTWCSDRAWWGFGTCTENTTQRFSFTADFTRTRSGLLSVLSAANQNAGMLVTSYAPTQAWLDSLPDFSNKFNAAADRALAVQQTLKPGLSPTPEQQKTLVQALTELDSYMNNAAGSLQSGVKVLADSLQRQSAYRDSILRAIDTAGQSANDELGRLKLQVQQKANPSCYDNLVNNNFNPIRNQFADSIQAIQAAFQKLDASSRDAEKGLGLLLGNIISFRTDVQSVTKLVSAATTDQTGSFIAKLRLAAAKTQWSTLAAAR